MSGVAERVSPLERALVDLLADRPAPFRRLPVSLLSREQKAAELVGVQALQARTAAYEAELVLGLAEDSPDDDDPPPGTPGAPPGAREPGPARRAGAGVSARWPGTPRPPTPRRRARRVPARGRGSPIPSCRGCRSSSSPSWR